MVIGKAKIRSFKTDKSRNTSRIILIDDKKVPAYPVWLEHPNPELPHWGAGLSSSLEWWLFKVVLLTTP